LIVEICALAAGKVPVIVNITDPSRTESLRLAEHAARAGAAGLAISPPYYFTLTQAELLGYLERLAPKLPRPLYLYNFPALTKIGYSVETVERASQMENVWGMKDSSGDMSYFAAVCAAMKDFSEFTILLGPEEQLEEAMAMGAHGGITGGANLSPELYVEFFRAIEAGDAERVAKAKSTVMKISKGIYNLKKDGSSYLRGLKCALSLLGYGNNVLAEPYVAYGDVEMKQIRGVLREVGLF
jgi:4-hydroxy-tetrahydrodipicolinate synthase